MEIALRQRLEGVAAVTISESAQTTEVIFAPGDYPFSVDVFKAALRQAEVEVVTLEVDACGTVEQRGDKRWLQAGLTQFALAAGSGPGPGGACVAGRLQEEAGQVQLLVTRVERPAGDQGP
jgi:hypothetical protein